MPGIDFRAVRELTTMADVLQLIGFKPSSNAGDVLRGPCPVHQSKSEKSRSFAVNVQRKVYRCFSCGAGGNHLDLYAAATQKRLFEAARDLCEKLHREIPWIRPRR